MQICDTCTTPTRPFCAVGNHCSDEHCVRRCDWCRMDLAEQLAEADIDYAKENPL